MAEPILTMKVTFESYTSGSGDMTVKVTYMSTLRTLVPSFFEEKGIITPLGGLKNRFFYKFYTQSIRIIFSEMAEPISTN